jgi:hypothetical protein
MLLKSKNRDCSCLSGQHFYLDYLTQMVPFAQKSRFYGSTRPCGFGKQKIDPYGRGARPRIFWIPGQMARKKKEG